MVTDFPSLSLAHRFRSVHCKSSFIRHMQTGSLPFMISCKERLMNLTERGRIYLSLGCHKNLPEMHFGFRQRRYSNWDLRNLYNLAEDTQLLTSLKKVRRNNLELSLAYFPVLDSWVAKFPGTGSHVGSVRFGLDGSVLGGGTDGSATWIGFLRTGSWKQKGRKVVNHSGLSSLYIFSSR